MPRKRRDKDQSLHRRRARNPRSPQNFHHPHLPAGGTEAASADRAVMDQLPPLHARACSQFREPAPDGCAASSRRAVPCAKRVADKR
ncbi:MAG: hypothetical protein MZV49_15890 [Rhodopseudomonas palustris]|nr:hypothetical protein [Rhodopseudomonas palustris]